MANSKVRLLTYQVKRLAASFRLAPEGVLVQNEVHGRKVIKFAIQTPTAASEQEIAGVMEAVGSGNLAPLTADQLETYLGSKESDIRKIETALKDTGLTILPRTLSDRAHGIVRVRGTYAAAKRFLPGLRLSVYHDQDGREFLGRQGEISVRAGLPVEGIFGLDNREVAKAKFRLVDDSRQYAASLGTARDIAAAQGVPIGVLTDLRHAVVAYISLGGDNGSNMQRALKRAAKQAGVKPAKVIVVSVNGATANGDPDAPETVENLLDQQTLALMLAGGYCVVFVAPNDDDSFAQAIETAVTYSGVNAGNALLPLMGVSISWGIAESMNTQQSLQRWARAYTAARLRGLIVTAAAGDNGSKDNTDLDTPDCPSCVPNGFGVGGLELLVTDGKVSGTMVWNDMSYGGGATGGGPSGVFPPTTEELSLGLPSSVFVSKVTNKPGHISTTFADDAAPASGAQVYMVDGTTNTVGGTSFSAPFTLAKLCAIQSQLNEPIPDMMRFVFEHARDGIFKQVTTPGSNGDYSVHPDDLYAAPAGFGLLDYLAFLKVAQNLQNSAPVSR